MKILTPEKNYFRKYIKETAATEITRETMIRADFVPRSFWVSSPI